MLNLTVKNVIEKRKTISKSEIQFFKREKHFLKEKNNFTSEIQFPFKIPF